MLFFSPESWCRIGARSTIPIYKKLAAEGVHDTLAALANGQVDDLFLSASLEEIHETRKQ